jgi:Flp pilus assembly protein TadD
MRNVILISVLFAQALLLASCGSGPASIVDGKKLLSDIQDGPKVPKVEDALLDTAKQAEERGDYNQAISLYRQLLEKYPNHKDIALPLADCYRKSGNMDQAIVIYDGLLKDDPTNIDAKEGKGLALVSKGDFETPGKLFGEVVEKDPSRWKSLNAMGILFTTRGMQPEAQQYFGEALKQKPGSVTVLNNLGLSQALERKYSDAITTLSDASNGAERNSLQRKRVDLNMALVYAIMNRLDDARLIASNYYSGAELENNMGIYSVLAHDDEMARAYLNMALSNSKVFYEKAWNNLQVLNGNQPQ